MELPATYRPNFDSDLLQGLSEQQKQTFLSDCVTRTHLQPKDILQQGLATDTFFIVEQGQVEVSYIDPNGNSLVVFIAGPGEVLGEVEALSGRPCAATCTALPGSRVLCCSSAVLLKHVPAQLLIVNLAGLLHDRLVRDNRQRSVDNFMTADQRIDHYLHQLTTEAEPKINVSQAYLATLAGCTRQTVNLRLNLLRQQGIVEFSRGEILVLDRDGLQASGSLV